MLTTVPDALTPHMWIVITNMSARPLRRVLRRVVHAFDAQLTKIIVKVYQLRFGPVFAAFARPHYPQYCSLVDIVVLQHGCLPLVEDWWRGIRRTESLRGAYEPSTSIRLQMLHTLASLGAPLGGHLYELVTSGSRPHEESIFEADQILEALLNMHASASERCTMVGLNMRASTSERCTTHGDFAVQAAIRDGRPRCVHLLLSHSAIIECDAWCIVLYAAVWEAYQVATAMALSIEEFGNLHTYVRVLAQVWMPSPDDFWHQHAVYMTKGSVDAILHVMNRRSEVGRTCLPFHMYSPKARHMAPFLIWLGNNIPHFQDTNLWENALLPLLLPEIGVVPVLRSGARSELYPQPQLDEPYADCMEWGDWFDHIMCPEYLLYSEVARKEALAL